MPIIARLEFKDGSAEVLRIPVQAWLQNEERFSKLVATEKELVAVELDPFQEIPDVDRSNDSFARRIGPAQILNLAPPPPRMPNPMQTARPGKDSRPGEASGPEARQPGSHP